MEAKTGKKFHLLDCCNQLDTEKYTLASPYAINGLEFQAVILLGADEGRLPQTAGTGDISHHFLLYSAYNMLYLSASRAKYRIIIMGSEMQGISSCLEHSLQTEMLQIEKHTELSGT